MSLVRLIFLAFGVAMLSSCAAQRGLDLPPLSDWETRQKVLTATTEWAFVGRIGVSAGSEGFNGKLRWHQNDDDYQASISGPLGVGAIKITGNGSRVSVTDRRGDVTVLENPEDDLRAMYGWTIPVTSLRYWALGVPDPTLEATTVFDDNGQLTRLEQGHWVVDIRQYREGGGQQMPRRITAVNGDAKVRLVIDRWTFF